MIRRSDWLLFRLGLVAVFTSICLSAYVLAHAQTGPSWEVPVAILQELRTVPIVALLLAVVALGFYLGSRRLGRVEPAALRGFWIAWVIAVIFPLAIWLGRPEQWPFQYVTLSFFAMILVVPTVIASLFCFWLIGFRWLRAVK